VYAASVVALWSQAMSVTRTGAVLVCADGPIIRMNFILKQSGEPPLEETAVTQNIYSSK
jgi:hypothetical protein